MIVSCAAAVLPIAVCLLLLTRARGTWRGWSADAPLAAGLAFGLAGVVWCALSYFPMRSSRVLILADLVVWTTVALICLSVVRFFPVAARRVPRSIPRGFAWLSLALFLPVCALGIIAFASASVALPHGAWDAWAIWNLRARFFFRGYPALWPDAFSPVLAWSHPDYPLLLSLTVSRWWTLVGHETVMGPVLTAAVFAVATVESAAASVARARDTGRGLMTATAILACPAFLKYAPSQCADLPLSFFILTTFVMMARATAGFGSSRLYWMLAGASAACAACTKNEGVVFFVAAFVCCAVWAFADRGRGVRPLAALGLGAAPVLVVLVLFKWWVAPANYMVEEQSLAQAVSKMFDGSRLQLVVRSLAGELWFGGARTVGVLPILCAYVAVAGRRPGEPAPRIALATIALTAAVYVLGYLVTPKDLVWQLHTSLDRLILQLFPTLVWSLMLIAR